MESEQNDEKKKHYGYLTITSKDTVGTVMTPLNSSEHLNELLTEIFADDKTVITKIKVSRFIDGKMVVKNLLKSLKNERK
jgi:hypothetical protein